MPANTIIVGNQPPTDQAILIGTPKLEMPASGWDVLTEKLWLPDPYFIALGSQRYGPPPEEGLFIAQDRNVLEWKGGRPIVEITSLGIAQRDGKPYKAEASGNVSEDLGLANVDTLTPTIWRRGYPRVTVLWVATFTPEIDAHVRARYTPPDTFGLPSGGWGIAWTAPDQWAASGWIGESRNAQQLPGSKFCLVTDTWLYDPGDDDRDGVRAGIIYL